MLVETSITRIYWLWYDKQSRRGKKSIRFKLKKIFGYGLSAFVINNSDCNQFKTLEINSHLIGKKNES